MSIHWSRPFLETLLPEDLLERLPEAQVAPSLSFGSARAEGYTVPFYNGKTGDHIVELPMKNNVRVSRRRFRNLCSEGIDIKVCRCHYRFQKNLQAHKVAIDRWEKSWSASRTPQQAKSQQPLPAA